MWLSKQEVEKISPEAKWAILNLLGGVAHSVSGLKSLFRPVSVLFTAGTGLIASNGRVYRIKPMPISRYVTRMTLHHYIGEMKWDGHVCLSILVLSRLESIMSHCSNSIDWLIEFFLSGILFVLFALLSSIRYDIGGDEVYGVGAFTFLQNRFIDPYSFHSHYYHSHQSTLRISLVQTFSLFPGSIL